MAIAFLSVCCAFFVGWVDLESRLWVCLDDCVVRDKGVDGVWMVCMCVFNMNKLP